MAQSDAEILAMVMRLTESDFKPTSRCSLCIERVDESASSHERKLLVRRGCPHGKTSADTYEDTWRDLVSEIKPTSAKDTSA